MKSSIVSHFQVSSKKQIDTNVTESSPISIDQTITSSASASRMKDQEAINLLSCATSTKEQVKEDGNCQSSSNITAEVNDHNRAPAESNVRSRSGIISYHCDLISDSNIQAISDDLHLSSTAIDTSPEINDGKLFSSSSTKARVPTYKGNVSHVPLKTEAKFFQKQMTLSKLECDFCAKVNTWEELVTVSLEPMKLKYCHCNNENCCCVQKIQNMQDECFKQTPYYNKVSKEVDDNFFCKYDPISKSIRHFCFKCVRYGVKSTLVGSMSVGGDWVYKGRNLGSVLYRINSAMKRHLTSKEHQESLQVESERNLKKRSNNLPTDSEKATKNLLIAVQMMASYHLPYRFLPLLCTSIHVMSCDNQTSHLLGNNNQSHNIVPKAQYACYKACMEKMRDERVSILPATEQSPRFQVCADKGTAHKDCSRQAIVETHIGSDGYPVESLVSVERVSDSTADEAAIHFTKHTSKLLDTQNIAVISTDGAATYTGKHKGMFQLLKADHSSYSEKLMYLPDLCHRAERLISNNNPLWLEEVIETSDKLISKFNSSPLLRQALLKFENPQNGTKLFAMQGTCDTRYAEYMHTSLQSVLNNFKIMNIALPEIVSSNDFDQKTKQRSENILTIMRDPSFVAKLILIDNVYMHIEAMEKEAQSSCFGAFDYERVTVTLKEALQTRLSTADQNALDVILTGIFKHEFVSNRKKYSFAIDLRYKQNCNSDDERELDSSKYGAEAEKLKEDYEKWIKDILSDFENYINIPPVIETAINVFTLNANIPVDERVQSLRDFIRMINTNFLSCGSLCKGLQSCSCLEEELKRFLLHVKDEIKVTHEEPWSHVSTSQSHSSFDSSCDYTQYNYSRIFAHYLADSNFKLRENLQIVNVLRALEVVQLLKASQSSTERVFSIVSKVVHGRFENRYRLVSNSSDPDTPDADDILNENKDAVAAGVFLCLNSNVVTLDARLARQKFLEAGHQEALIGSKPSSTVGKTVRNMLEKFKKPPISRKRKYAPLPLTRMKKSQKTSNQLNSEIFLEWDEMEIHHQPDIMCEINVPTSVDFEPTQLTAKKQECEAHSSVYNTTATNISDKFISGQALSSDSRNELKNENNLTNVHEDKNLTAELGKSSVKHELFMKRNILEEIKVKKERAALRQKKFANFRRVVDQPCTKSVHRPTYESKLCQSSSVLSDLKEPVLSPQHTNATKQYKSSGVFTNLKKPVMPPHDKKRVMYCKCRTPYYEPKRDMIACSTRKKDCLSFKANYQMYRAEGGNWFHLDCVSQNVAPRLGVKWFCLLCEESSPFSKTAIPKPTTETHSNISTAFKRLEIDLKRENRTLVRIRGDGNCMFRMFSIDMFGTEHSHEVVRKNMSRKLEAILTNERWTGRWNRGNCPVGDELNDNEARFVRSIVKLHTQLFFRNTTVADDIDRDIPLENRITYVKTLAEPTRPGDSSSVFLSKYGGELEMELYSLLEEKNIWLLQATCPTMSTESISTSLQTPSKHVATNLKRHIVAYRWYPVHWLNSYPPKSHEYRLRDSHPYACFFYELNDNEAYCHYWGIAPLDKDQPMSTPTCKAYNYSGYDDKFYACLECTNSDNML